MREEKEQQPEEREEPEATTLSAREAMSLIAPERATQGEEHPSSEDRSEPDS
jgi:hypothetical protein